MASNYVNIPITEGTGPAAGVDSFNGRTGVVAAQAGDYSAPLIFAATGIATLSAGTVVVSEALVTADSRIFLTAQTLGTVTVGQGLAVSARSAGVSFTIKSQAANDTSTVAWFLYEP